MRRGKGYAISSAFIDCVTAEELPYPRSHTNHVNIGDPPVTIRNDPHRDKSPDTISNARDKDRVQILNLHTHEEESKQLADTTGLSSKAEQKEIHKTRTLPHLL